MRPELQDDVLVTALLQPHDVLSCLTTNFRKIRRDKLNWNEWKRKIKIWYQLENDFCNPNIMKIMFESLELSARIPVALTVSLLVVKPTVSIESSSIPNIISIYQLNDVKICRHVWDAKGLEFDS